MGFWEDISGLRKTGKIPRTWKRADIRPHLQHSYAPRHIVSRPSNDSLSRNGQAIGDSVKKGSKPKAWRVGVGAFELIEDPQDSPSLQQAERQKADRICASARSVGATPSARSAARHASAPSPPFSSPQGASTHATGFDSVVAKMPQLLQLLQDCTPLLRRSLTSLPARGVYVFYENGTPVYVGRSNHLRKRILTHGRPSSQHNAATFAFILAKEEATKRSLTVSAPGRLGMQNDPVFSQLYLSAKDRVGRMQIRVIEVSDPIEQTLFEVYAALTLNTPYNDFQTH